MVTVLALAFVLLGEHGFSIPAIRFHFNMYTGPVYFSAFLDIVNIVILVLLFRDYKLVTIKKRTKKKAERAGKCVRWWRHIINALVK